MGGDAPRLSRLFRLTTLAMLSVLLLSSFEASAAQTDATSAAGLIVDTGQGEPIYVVVTFTGSEVRALDLLRDAELDAVTVDFGGLGSAVCAIATVGCDVDSCRQRLCQTGDPESPFWQYLEPQPDGGWKLSPLGASQATVGDGEIAAWAWTGVPPDLPELSFRDVAEQSGAPDDVALGEISGEPVAYVSGLEEDGNSVSASGAIASAGVISLVAVVGVWLVLRQRAGEKP